MPLTFWTGLLCGVLASGLAATAAGAWAYRRFIGLERRAAHAERLAELGMLTGGLAHEIKNPLSTLQLNLQLLREDLADLPDAPPRTAKRVDSLAREATRLREILDDFLRYAGNLTVAPADVDLAAVAGDLVDFLAPQAQVGRVDLRGDLRPARARADAKLVKQALMNLALNAIQHTPAGGSVTVSTGPAPDGGARVSVSDTGPGIAPADAARVFDPYYTRRRGGTGLGLALTRRIADAHGGRVDLDTRVGRGSTFTLVLPDGRPRPRTERPKPRR